MAEAAFAFGGGVELHISGRRWVVDAFRREYRPLAVRETAAGALDVRFGPEPDPSLIRGRGRHKSVAWSVGVSPAAETHVRCDIRLSGWPRSFGRSLVQGYIVEPLLSVVAAEHGTVLVPGAAYLDDGRATLILGRSRAGKSTLMARTMAAGVEVLGDDQVFIDPGGLVRAFPRRLRFYPDLAATAPSAYARLPRALRRRLRLQGLVARLTRGFVRPSMAVEREAIGGRWIDGSRPLARIILLERGDARSGLTTTSADAASAVAWAERLLAEQRTKLPLHVDAAWNDRLATVRAGESVALRAAFEGADIEHVTVSSELVASQAVSAVAGHLRLPG